MRAVLDTNTIVSGILWGGPPHELLTVHVPRQTLALCTSPPLLEELNRVLQYRHLARRSAVLGLDVPRSLATIIERAETYRELPTINLIPTDPPDNLVLATAVAAQADAIISGDHHLRQLKDFAVPILTAAEAVRQLRAAA